jgi:hypothetical protein
MNIGTRGTEQRNSFIPQSRVRCGGPSVGFVSARTGMLIMLVAVANKLKIQLLLSGPTARPSKRRSWLDGLLLLQGDRPTSKMDASIPEPTPWPTSSRGKTALFNNRPFLEEIDDGQNPFLENPNSNIPRNGPFANASEHGSVDRLECAMGVTPGVADSLFGPDLR